MCSNVTSRKRKLAFGGKLKICLYFPQSKTDIRVENTVWPKNVSSSLPTKLKSINSGIDKGLESKGVSIMCQYQYKLMIPISTYCFVWKKATALEDSLVCVH